MKLTSRTFKIRSYDLGVTLNSGQSFRWNATADGWEGVVGQHWVVLRDGADSITCSTVGPVQDWDWITDYLQTGVDLDGVIATYPKDAPMRKAVQACKGLRLLRQHPWECLASFILSSTKQITQIRQIVGAVSRSFGSSVAVPPGHEPAHCFPGPETIARLSDAELRMCKMGFRAPFLKAAAQAVASGELDLDGIRKMDLETARQTLTQLDGVGPKIANCVLLFAYGFPTAFPADVWILRALRDLYFPGGEPAMKTLVEFSETHFGPYSGYAQQYLFHAVRTKKIPLPDRKGTSRGKAPSRKP